MSCSAAVLSPVEAHDSTPMDVCEPDEFDSACEQRPVIIFDWDDTLLSSSWLAGQNFRLDRPAVLPQPAVKQLALLAESMVKVLRLAKASGQVVIITNAETGWVELSAKRFVPQVLEELKDVRIISARSTYEAEFPDSPKKWKLAAFHREIHDAVDDMGPHFAPPCVISFGDSIHERDAVHEVCEPLKSTLTKSIKFVERPSIEQLHRELELVCRCFSFIVDSEDPLDLMLTIQLLNSSA